MASAQKCFVQQITVELSLKHLSEIYALQNQQRFGLWLQQYWASFACIWRQQVWTCKSLPVTYMCSTAVGTSLLFQHTIYAVPSLRTCEQRSLRTCEQRCQSRVAVTISVAITGIYRYIKTITELRLRLQILKFRFYLRKHHGIPSSCSTVVRLSLSVAHEWFR